MRKQFGLLTILIIVLSIVAVLITCTEFATKTKAFVAGEGDELIENIIKYCNDGGRIIVMDRTDKSELDHIVDRIYDDPYLFWVDTTYNSMSIGKISMIVLREKYDNIDAKRIELSDAADEILNSIIHDNMSEYQKVLEIHDWICKNVSYAQADDDSDQDAYGAIVRKKARCAGYAEAFAYLLNKVGIRAEVMSGASLDKYGQSVSHAWNLVYIDGEPYYFDITWDDDGIVPSYWWFGVTSSEFQKSHFASHGYDWVEADSMNACYYIRNNMYLQEYNATVLAYQIKQQGKVLSIKCANGIVFDKVVWALSNQTELQKIMKMADIDYITQITYSENKYTNCIDIKIL